MVWDQIYEFDAAPTGRQLDQILAEGAAQAAALRAQRGLALPEAGTHQDGRATRDGALRGGVGEGGVRGGPAALPSLVDGVPLAADPGVIGAGGATNFGAGVGRPGRAAGGSSGGLPAAGIAHLLDGGGPLNGPTPAADVARTLAILTGADGIRYREIRDGTRLLSPSEFPDWPVRGPRTTEWVCRFVSETTSTPLRHHERWKFMRRRPATDHVVSQH